jgi:LL-diaminopimelate aminotransferase
VTRRCFPDPGYQPYLGGTLLAGGEPYAVPLRPENEFLIPSMRSRATSHAERASCI